VPSGSDNTEMLVRYLLGQLSEEERHKLEEEYLGNETLHEELLAVETELMDAHSRGDLSLEEQRHILGRSSKQNVRQRMLFSEALRRRISHPPREARAVASASQFISNALNALYQRRWFALAAFATFALLIVGVAQIGRRVALDKSLVQGTTRRATPEVQPLRPVPPTLSLILLPGQRSAGHGNKLMLPQVERIVRIQIVLEEAGHYPGYEAALKAVDQPFSQTFKALSIQVGTKGERELVVECPSGKFRPGDYAVSVYGTRHGSRQEIAGYFFRVEIP
jgi:hypothetical protein